jgi:hypothetical protein
MDSCIPKEEEVTTSTLPLGTIGSIASLLATPPPKKFK